MQDLPGGVIGAPQDDEGNQGHDPVMSDLRALLLRVHASIGVVEDAMHTALGQDADASETFFVLDDITPRYLKLRFLLGEVDASLRAALHDS
jgi:hypothetical protein